MQARVSDNMVTVTLSERNLLALMAQLKDPSRPAPALVRAGGDGEPTVLVQAQTDEDHYGERAPGEMRISTTAGMVTASEHFGLGEEA